MKFIITNDFYTDFEVIEAPTREDAEKYITDCLNCLNYNETDNAITVIGSSEDCPISLDEWLAIVDGKLFVSDYE